MKKLILLTALLVVTGILLPAISHAQGVASDIHSMQGVLDQLYADMIPLCSKLIGVGRGLAGFGALWYIGSRVWKQIAQAEAIDFYPLLRPFAMGIAVLLFPAVISLINGVLQPTVTATAEMMSSSNDAITKLLAEKEKAVKQTEQYQMYVGTNGTGDQDKWEKYTQQKDDGLFSDVGNSIKFALAKYSYNFRNSVKQWMSEVLQVLYEAASLCINTIRTFYLIVLAIMGPLVFGFAVFDGFQHTLTVWLARYINVFLWLPVANIFGSIIAKIQENMLKVDLSQIQNNGDTFFSPTDTGYLIFMLIGIVGYFTVPGVAGYIVHAGGGNALLAKVTHISSGMAGSIGGGAVSAGGGMVSDMYGDSKRWVSGVTGQSENDYFKDKDNSSHQRDRLSGNA